MDNRPIGFIDSGIGGLTILRAARRLLPREHMLFLADSAHFPYGAIEPADLCSLTTRLAACLLDRGCKLIVVACNTATVHALAHLRATFPMVPFVGVVPVVKTLAQQTRSGTIALLSTPATAESAYLADLVSEFAAHCSVINIACPGLADLVEGASANDPVIIRMLEHYLTPVRSSNADVLGLGCTHYPFLRPHIRRIIGPGVRIYDSALPVARRIHAVLSERGALAPARQGQLELFATGDTDGLYRMAQRFRDCSRPVIRMTIMDDEALRRSGLRSGSASQASHRSAEPR